MAVEIPNQVPGGASLGRIRKAVNDLIGYLGFTEADFSGETNIYPYFEDFTSSVVGAYADTGVAGFRKSIVNSWLQVNHENASEIGRDASILGDFVREKYFGTLFLNNSVTASNFVNMIFARPTNFIGTNSNIKWVRNVDFYFRVSAGIAEGTRGSADRKLFVGLFGLDDLRAQSIDIDASIHRRWIGVEFDTDQGPEWRFRRDLGSAIGTDTLNVATSVNVASLTAGSGLESEAFDNIVISLRDGLPVLTYINGVQVNSTPWSEISTLNSGALSTRPMRPCVYVQSTGAAAPVLLPTVDYIGVNFVSTSTRPFNAVIR